MIPPKAAPGTAAHRTPPLLVSAAALINAQGAILISQRPQDKSHAGAWEFPGGKIEAGESAESALIRELKEELGIDVTASCLAPCAFSTHDYTDFSVILLLFVCRKWQGRPQGREGQSLQWVAPPRLFDVDMLPADRPLLGILNAVI